MQTAMASFLLRDTSFSVPVFVLTGYCHLYFPNLILYLGPYAKSDGLCIYVLLFFIPSSSHNGQVMVLFTLDML